ncbi:MAG: hypothetical protein JNL58_16625 [Planctomyces sp.]|nr:hypothetical protein [Planctomyces sp.]
MNPHHLYKDQNRFSWTRIDMLLVVYEQTIDAIQRGADAIAAGRTNELISIRLRTMKCLVTIIDGLNQNAGDTPQQILRLCLFVLDQVETDELESWQSALKIMQTLYDGFQGIQDEAREAEHRGEIPALDASA